MLFQTIYYHTFRLRAYCYPIDPVSRSDLSPQSTPAIVRRLFQPHLVGPLMRPICHPLYEYRPATASAKAKMSASHRARFGNPAGWRRLYGQNFPDAVAEELRPTLCWLAQKQTRAMAEAAALAFKERGEEGLREHLKAWARAEIVDYVRRARARERRRPERQQDRDLLMLEEAMHNG